MTGPNARFFEALLSLCKYLAKFGIAFILSLRGWDVKSPTNSMIPWGLFTIATKVKTILDRVYVKLNFSHLTQKSGLSRSQLALS